MLTQLEADRTRVTDIEAQILHLEHSLRALWIEKSLAQERLDSYTYPVLTLPNEIVSEIFMRFLPTYPRFTPFTGILSPTILTQICRKWREIALGTPALWSVMSDDHDLPFALQAHAFNIWLDRSCSCPLSLRFGLDGCGVDIIAVLAAVVPHRARWERLELCSLSPSHLSILGGPMPMLRYLDLGIDFPAVGTEAVVFEAPLLRAVILNDEAASQIILPWTQLTSLTLVCVHPHECVPILQQTSNLVRCELHICFDPDNDQPGPDLTLPYLESLTLVDVDDPAMGFIETFIVPALRSLRIPEEFLDADPIESLKRFISKSGCKLEKLHITRQRTPQNSYRQAFPWIRNFSFNNERSDEWGPSDVETSS
jgi:hypothetical protein